MPNRLFAKLASLSAHKNLAEIISYLFFGGLTFLLSVASYMVLSEWLCIRPVIANIISWVLAVLFAYYTNRKWVFHGEESTFSVKLRQLAEFMGARIFTLIIEEAMLWLFVEKLRFSNFIIKVTAQMVVIVLNYVFSKFLIFKKSR